MNDPTQIARVAQLTQRTNQFNVTGRRYSERNITDLLHDPSYRMYTLALEDRFGSYGTVGVVILRRVSTRFGGGAVYQIDVFCLSCRAIGLSVERALMTAVIEDLHILDAQAQIRSEYVPTGRNQLVSDLYEALGFIRQQVVGLELTSNFFVEVEKLAAHPSTTWVDTTLFEPPPSPTPRDSVTTAKVPISEIRHDLLRTFLSGRFASEQYVELASDWEERIGRNHWHNRIYSYDVWAVPRIQGLSPGLAEAVRHHRMGKECVDDCVGYSQDWYQDPNVALNKLAAVASFLGQGNDADDKVVLALFENAPPDLDVTPVFTKLLKGLSRLAAGESERVRDAIAGVLPYAVTRRTYQERIKERFDLSSKPTPRTGQRQARGEQMNGKEETEGAGRSDDAAKDDP